MNAAPRRSLLALAAPLLLAACAAGDDGSSPGHDGVPQVVATTTQVGSVVRELGGDAVAITVLLAPGVEAHDFEMTPQAAAALEEADLVLLSGAGLEDWLADSIAAARDAGRVVDLSSGVELRMIDGATDPHYWLAAPGATRMVENARDALLALAPDAAEDIDGRADALLDRLDAADAEVRRLIEEVPPADRQLVTDHDALGYFVDAYGLEFVGSIFPSLDVTAEPSAQEIETLVAQIRDRGVRAIFTESSVNPRLAEAIASESDAQLVTEPLYTDALGPDGSGAETLDGVLVHNATVIRDGLLGD